MSDEASFKDLLRRTRAGDEAAAAELVRLYEPTIRRTIRVRLRDPRLGRLMDSMDICQSVMASFFLRAAMGQFDLEAPEDLIKLLSRMARNKLSNAVEHHRAQRRDYRRAEVVREDLDVAAGISPSRQVAGLELLAEAQRRLTPEERQLIEMRREGRPWADIAQELGGSPDGLRVRLQRAVDRVAQELGLEEEP
jgi:RNA polymerase sigma-70 factor (ECF subfamily)